MLSHRSAAELWGIRDSARSAIDITARRGHARPGIDVHSATTLRPADTTTVDGIPCTTVARTLLDNAEAGDRRAVERAIDQAEVLRILDAKAVDDVLEHANGRRGAPLLQDVLATLDLGQTLTKRELEERVLTLCAAAGIPRPLVNAWIPLDDGYGDGGLEADFFWPDRRLILEADSYRFHGTRGAFERDRRRDQRLLVVGLRTIRVTWRHVIGEPRRVAETILSYG